MKFDCTLYLVTDRRLLCGETLPEAVEQAVLGGCTMVQLREKELSSDSFYRLAVSVKSVTDRYRVPLIINDRVDIALAAGAAGVHVGQSDLPAAVVKRLLPPGMILGVSVTTPAEARKAVSEGADYLGVGAIYPTNTKTDAHRVSMEELQEIRRAVDVPMVAIGGISRENAAVLRAAQVDGLAVVSAILAQPDRRAAAAELKQRFCADSPAFSGADLSGAGSFGD